MTSTKTFADLGVDADIVAALADHGIIHPFPIQEQAIPVGLTGADLIGQARTGTGKTLAYGIPLLQRIKLDHSRPRALVMAPTRELAIQVANDVKTAGAKLDVRVVTIYGGVSYDDQLDSLERGVDIVVGTPGRLLDLAQRKSLDLGGVTELVLDEADEMLDLGFLPDVERLVSMVPASHHTMLFSATMPAQIMALARGHLNQPLHIRAEADNEQLTVPDTRQLIYQAHELDKPEMIARIIQSPDVKKMMIFTHTKRSAQRLADELADRGFNAASLHGDLNQRQREKTLRKLRNGEITVLVATDVAARGIDIADVTHVINLEVPDDAEQYVHRIGRTGRAGHSGVAVTLVDWSDVTRWRVINKTLGLDYSDVPETYSTSPHLFSDLNIPEGVKGRLTERGGHHRGPRRGSTARRSGSTEGTSQGKSQRRRRRPRVRRRNGVVVKRESDQ